MNKQSLNLLLTTFLILANTILLTIILVQGKAFLIPFVTAIILAMIMNPVYKRFKKMGLGNTMSILLADCIIVLFFALMGFLLIAQVNGLIDNWPEIEKKIHPELVQFEYFLHDNFNISGLPDVVEDGKAANAEGASQVSDSTNATSSGGGQVDFKSGIFGFSSLLNSDTVRDNLFVVVEGFVNMMSSLVMILVYIFFFMLYQTKFEKAILAFVPEGKREKASHILAKSASTTQNYLLGRFLLVIILAVLYAVAFAIIGLEYSILVALIAALFSLLPYIGNVVGLVLALAVSFASGGGVSQMIVIGVVFTIFQFIENNILEPFVVGDSVDLNPLIVIVGVVLGGMVWGMMGMLLAIPIFGICRAAFNNIEILKPLGYLLDGKDISESPSKFQKKIKRLFSSEDD